MKDFDVVIGCELIYRLSEEIYEALVQSIEGLMAPTGQAFVLYEFRDGLGEDMEFFDRANAVFDVEVMTLEKYGCGVPLDDADSRMMYTYTHLPKSA